MLTYILFSYTNRRSKLPSLQDPVNAAWKLIKFWRRRKRNKLPWNVMKHHVFQPILISPFKGTRAMWVPVLFFCHFVMCLAPCCLTNLIIRDNLLTPFIGYWWSKSCQFSLMFFSPEKGTQYSEKRNNGTYIILRHCSASAFVIFLGVNLQRSREVSI